MNAKETKKAGDHLKALVSIDVISSHPEENEKPDLDSDLAKLRSLTSFEPIEI